MNKFAVKFLDGHVVVQIKKYDYIIDTGSPVSFGRGTTIIINKKKFPITDGNLLGATAESISALSGLKIDGFLSKRG